MKHKMKWKVAEAPTGLYRGFQYRAWPSLYVGDMMIAHITVGTNFGANKPSYRASYAKEEVLGFELKVSVAEPHDNSFNWRSMTRRFTNLAEAKKAAEEFFEKNPQWIERRSQYAVEMAKLAEQKALRQAVRKEKQAN